MPKVVVTFKEALGSFEALRALLAQDKIPFKSRRRAAKVAREVELQVVDINKAKEALDKASMKMVKGKPVPVEGTPGAFAVKDPEAYSKAMEEIMAQMISIEGGKIPEADLEKSSLTGAHLAALDWLID